MALPCRRQRWLHTQRKNSWVTVCVAGFCPRPRREELLVVPGPIPIPHSPPHYYLRDNNLTWLHLHRQKCHIIILIWQRPKICWQLGKMLPATVERGGLWGAIIFCYAHTCTHTCTHTCMRACMHAQLHVHTETCACTHAQIKELPHQFIQACSWGSTHSIQTHRVAGISMETQSQQQLTMRVMNRPKSCTAGI